MMATRPGAASAPPQHDAESMCRYPSKKCWNLRALKRNGERHNLCDLHRQKANKNQRRLELKRKARAQASVDSEPTTGKRLRAKKPWPRARRAPLSAHLAMREERARQQESLPSWFLQDLVLLDGHYDQSQAPVQPDAADEDVLDRILQEDAAALCKSLDATSGLEALAALPEGKTSPVDVGESWDNLDFSDYWLTTTPAEQPVSFDASAFVVDEDVFVADV